MNRWSTIVLALALTTAACSRAEGAEGAMPQAGGEPSAFHEEDGSKPFWWTALGEDRAAMVWFGAPYLNPQTGTPMRPWVLTCYLPGDNPYAWFQASVPLHSAVPVGFSSGEIELELFPIEGLTWAEIHSPEQLVPLSRGLTGM